MYVTILGRKGGRERGKGGRGESGREEERQEGREGGREGGNTRVSMCGPGAAALLII